MLVAVLFASLALAGDVAVCPGEGPRYGDFKCNHDGTHRVCAQLLEDGGGSPLQWGEGDFWSITGQKAFQWDKSIRSAPNPGDSWCICMWAFARMIERVGCENVHLHCESTDLAFVLDRYHDGGHRLDKAHECLKKTCPKQSGGSAADGLEVVASQVEVLTDKEGEGEL
jgi:hypothetical protein